MSAEATEHKKHRQLDFGADSLADIIQGHGTRRLLGWESDTKNTEAFSAAYAPNSVSSCNFCIGLCQSPSEIA